MGISRAGGLGTKKVLFSSLEQAILRNIEALEGDLLSEKDKVRQGELQEQITGLKESIDSVGPTDSQDLLNKISNLKNENASLKTDLTNASRGIAKVIEFDEESDKKNALFKLYELLLNKYSDIINEFEKKTVGEIKSMVNANDLTVQSIVEDFKKENYSFETDFLPAAKKTFSFISQEITPIKPNIDVNFWLTPKEIVNSRVGDDEDLAVFLCSALSALGDNNAEVVIAEMDDALTHSFVVTEVGKKFLLLDPSQRHGFEDFLGEKSAVLGSYFFKGTKIKRFLYKFNFEKYEQFI